MAGTTVESVRLDRGPYADPTIPAIIQQTNDIIGDLETLRAAGPAATSTWATEVDGDENNICNHLDYLLTPDGVVGGSYAFSAGAAATLAATGWVKYRISGIEYTAEMPTTVTLEDLGDVTQNNFSAWRIEISRAGAVTAKASPTVGGYSSAQIALLALGGLAPTASCATLGYLTLTDSDSVINIGTDNLNASGVTATIYYERGPRKRITGLNTAHGAVSTLTAASTTFGHGTYDVNVNGLKVTQIAAQAAQALTDADTIPTLKFGAVLILSNLAKTAFVTLNAAGTPGVTSMSYATLALAIAAAGDVVDRLPVMFCPLTVIFVQNASVSTFTFKTTNWDATNIASTISDSNINGWDRTIASGGFSHQITRVAIPADVTATIPATVAAAGLLAPLLTPED